MGRVESELFRLFGPGFADVLIGREALQSLKALSEVVGTWEKIQMSPSAVTRSGLDTNGFPVRTCHVLVFGSGAGGTVSAIRPM